MTGKASEALRLVEGRWRETFLRFTETGEAPPEFLAYLDGDANCQKAVDMVLAAQEAALHRLGRALAAADSAGKDKEPAPRPSPAPPPKKPAAAAPRGEAAAALAAAGEDDGPRTGRR